MTAIEPKAIAPVTATTAAQQAHLKSTQASTPSTRCERPLDSEQMNRLNTIVSTTKMHTLTPDSNEFPPINFTVPELLTFLYDKLKQEDIISEVPCLVGGACGHVLTKLEHADIDVNFFLRVPAFSRIKECVQEFIAEKLKKPINRDLRIAIDSHYLLKKSSSNKFSYLGLGDVELKFIFDKECRWFVSSSDRLLIPLLSTNNKVFCIGDDRDFDTSLTELRHRKFVVIKPQDVDELLFRLVHKTTQGFEIISIEKAGDVTAIAVEKFCKEFSIKNLEALKKRVHSQLESHYSKENQLGKLLYLLNFLNFIQEVNDPPLRQAYTKTISAILKTDLPQFAALASLIENYPDSTKDVLMFVRGCFFLNWVSPNPQVGAYAFDFEKPNVPRQQFSLMHTHGIQYLSLGNSPTAFVEEFFSSWRKLEEQLAKSGEFNLLESLPKQLGFKNELSRKCKFNVLKTIAECFHRQPMASVLSTQYAGSLNLTSLCSTLQRENELLLKEDFGNDNGLAVTKCVVTLRLEQMQATAKTFQQNDLINLLGNLLNCLKKPSTEMFKVLITQLSDEGFKKQIKGDDTLHDMVWHTLGVCVRNFLPSNKHEDLLVLYELVQAVHVGEYFHPAARSELAILLMQNWKTVPQEDFTTQLETCKFLFNAKKWKEKTTALTHDLANSLSTISDPLIAGASSNATQLEQAFYYLSAAIIADPSKQDCNKKLYTSLILRAIEKGSGETLRLASTLAMQWLQSRPLELEDGNMLVELCKKLFTIQPKQLETGQQKSTYLQLGFKLLDTVAVQRKDMPNMRNFLLQTMASVLISNASETAMEKHFHQCVEIFAKLKDIPQGYIHSLGCIEESIKKSEGESFKQFMNVVSENDPTIATEIASKEAFIKHPQLRDRATIIWGLIEKFIDKDATTGIENAFKVFSKAIANVNGNLEISNLYGAIQLLFNIFTKSKNPDSAKVTTIVTYLTTTFNKITGTSHEITHLEKKLLELLFKLQEIGSVESLSIHNLIYNEATRQNLIGNDKRFALVKGFINQHLSKSIIPSKETVRMYLQMPEIGEKSSNSAQTVISLIHHRLKSEQPDVTYALEIAIDFLQGKLHDEVRKEFLNSIVQILVTYKQLKILHNPKSKLLFNEITSQQNLQMVSFPAQISLLKECLQNNLEKIPRFLFSESFQLANPAQRGDLSLVLLEHCSTISSDYFMSSLQLILSKHLQLNHQSYKYLFQYVVNLSKNEKKPEVLLEYSQLLEAQWKNVESLASGDDEADLFSNYLCEAYIYSRCPTYMSKACKIMQNQTIGLKDNMKMIVAFITSFQSLPVKKLNDEFITDVGIMIVSCLPNALRLQKTQDPSIEILVILKQMLDTEIPAHLNIVFETVYAFMSTYHDQMSQTQTNGLAVSTFNDSSRLKDQKLAYDLLIGLQKTFLKNSQGQASQKLDQLTRRYFNAAELAVYSKLIAEHLLLPHYESLLKLSPEKETAVNPTLTKTVYLIPLCTQENFSLGRKIVFRLFKQVSSSSEISYAAMMVKILNAASSTGIYTKINTSESDIKENNDFTESRLSAGILLIESCGQDPTMKGHEHGIQELLNLSELLKNDSSSEDLQKFLNAAALVHRRVLTYALFAKSETLYKQFLNVLTHILTHNIRNDNAEAVKQFLIEILQYATLFEILRGIFQTYLNPKTVTNLMRDPSLIEKMIRNDFDKQQIELTNGNATAANNGTSSKWTRVHAHAFTSIVTLISSFLPPDCFNPIPEKSFSDLRKALSDCLIKIITSERSAEKNLTRESRTATLLHAAIGKISLVVPKKGTTGIVDWNMFLNILKLMSKPK